MSALELGDRIRPRKSFRKRRGKSDSPQPLDGGGTEGAALGVTATMHVAQGTDESLSARLDWRLGRNILNVA